MRSRTRLRSLRPTSRDTASCSPAAARCCAASANGWSSRPACPSAWRTTRSRASRSAPDARSRRSRSWSARLSRHDGEQVLALEAQRAVVVQVLLGQVGPEPLVELVLALAQQLPRVQQRSEGLDDEGGGGIERLAGP